MKFDLFGKSTQGKREYQEDYLECLCQKNDDTDKCLAVLCDGMGGHEGGSVASELVVKTIIETFSDADTDIGPHEALRQSLAKAHNEVVKAIEGGAPSGMGTTLVAAYLEHDNLNWVSVGDSHLYLFRDNEIVKLNDDHSMASVLDQLADIGRISEEDAMSDPQRSALRSYISDEEIRLIDLNQKEGFLKAGDILILASDGLDSMGHDDFVGLMNESASRNSEEIVMSLLEGVDCIEKEDQDNTSIVVIRVDGEGIVSKVINKILGG